MRKINYDNAKERIDEMTKGYERKNNNDFLYTHIEMSEGELEKLLDDICNNSTKSFAEALNKTSRVTITANVRNCTIGTYRRPYLTVKII